MNMEELRKLLKENKICFYSYWGKKKLEYLARINNLLPEESKPIKQQIDYSRMKKIRNEPISVKFIDVETKEEKIYPSIYKAAQFIDKSPQTVAHYGKRKGIWNKKYQIIIE